jgi:hypothetical protein
LFVVGPNKPDPIVNSENGNRKLFLGIDVSTTGSKALLIDDKSLPGLET